MTSHNTRIYADTVEETALNQIQKIQSHPAFIDSKIRIMPDVHAGSGCVIGFTSTLSDKIVPNVIGVDIGCGMLATKIGKLPNATSIWEDLDRFIKESIPSGFNVRKHPPQSSTEHITVLSEILRTCKRIDLDDSRVFKSLGTLGGGNHFIEVGIDENEDYWLVIHSGSRNFGHKIASYYQSLAIVPDGFGKQEGYLETELKDTYLEDMKTAQEYATLNRLIMTEDIMFNFFNIYSYESIESVHNYIDFKSGIVRKGAISAQKGEKVVIPWNMRDGIVIGLGKGNADWNYSCCHGAGRIMGRAAAKKTLKLEDFQNSMKGIYSTSVTENTLDEAPMVYKDYTEIQRLIEPTVEITNTLKTIYNFKAQDSRKRR